MVRGLRRKRVPTGIGPSDFFEPAERARRLFGELVAGDPEGVALLPSASYGIAVAARNLPLEAGSTVVLTHEQFPGNVYAWRRAVARVGARIVTVEPPPGPGPGRARGWNRRLLEAVTPATAVVALPHVHWTDGTLFDLPAIAARAREVGAAVVVDGTQSVGALPFSVPEVRPDALVCAGYKWLLGPYSTAVAWFSEEIREGVPLEETWMGREGSRDFQGLVDYRDGYQPGARRHDVGEVANFALLPGLLDALGLVLEWGPGRIQAYTRALTRELVARAGEWGFQVEPEDGRGHHLFGIRMGEGVDLEHLKSSLDSAGVVASLRGSALRISPHLYNDEADVAALLEVLDASRGRGSGPGPGG